MQQPRFKTIEEVKSFCDFLHSEIRTQLVTEKPTLSKQEEIQRVTQADYDNWKDLNNL